jgi:hypothetical protein
MMHFARVNPTAFAGQRFEYPMLFATLKFIGGILCFVVSCAILLRDETVEDVVMDFVAVEVIINIDNLMYATVKGDDLPKDLKVSYTRANYSERDACLFDKYIAENYFLAYCQIFLLQAWTAKGMIRMLIDIWKIFFGKEQESTWLLKYFWRVDNLQLMAAIPLTLWKDTTAFISCEPLRQVMLHVGLVLSYYNTGSWLFKIYTHYYVFTSEEDSTIKGDAEGRFHMCGIKWSSDEKYRTQADPCNIDNPWRTSRFLAVLITVFTVQVITHVQVICAQVQKKNEIDEKKSSEDELLEKHMKEATKDGVFHEPMSPFHKVLYLFFMALYRMFYLFHKVVYFYFAPFTITILVVFS